MLNNLVIIAKPASLCKECLVFDTVGDIALTLSRHIEGTDAWMTFSKEAVEAFGDLEEIFATASRNGKDLCEIEAITDITLFGVSIFSPMCRLNQDPESMNCITLKDSSFGASVMFWDGVKERISELFGGSSFYIVFTSKHEAMVHRDSGDRTLEFKFRQLLNDMLGVVDEDEILTRELYYYNKGLNKIEVRHGAGYNFKSTI